MKSKIFNTDQIRAIQDGRMTQFMQVVKLQPVEVPDNGPNSFQWALSAQGRKCTFRALTADLLKQHMAEFCPFGKVGDVIYCREKWNHIINDESEKIGYYHSTDTDLNTTWLSPATMPREAARLFLRITNIRVMQTWELTEQDARAQGNEVDIVAGDIWTATDFLPGKSSGQYYWVIDFTKTDKP